MSREESVMVLCDTRARGPHIPGSWQMCSVCAVEIFLSDSTLRSADLNGFSREKLLLHCMDCAKPKLWEITEKVPLTEEQIAEINFSMTGI